MEEEIVVSQSTSAPKVSVCVITYNHESCIGQCLQSLVDQQTNFPFEIIVGDDASTDATRRIILSFVAAHPQIVRTIFQPRNTGGARNYLDVHAAAQGEYIAHVDGDDYALPGKLQAQSDCLDRHSEVSMTCHAVRVIGSGRVMGDDARIPTLGGVEDLVILGNYLVHSSTMYRRIFRHAYADPRLAFDYYMHLDLASKGRIYFDRTVYGCYRVQEGGLSRELSNLGKMEGLKNQALDHALELGIDPLVVRRERLKTRMYYGLKHYIAGDVKGYQERIRLHRTEFACATTAHIVLHVLRAMPRLVGCFLKVRTILTAGDPRRLVMP